MASTPTIATALASPTPSVNIPKARGIVNVDSGLSVIDKHAAALLTPPNSMSPDLKAHAVGSFQSIDAISLAHDGDAIELGDTEEKEKSLPAGTPLSKGALSGLDAAQTITPAMLAKHHLPGIMLGNGPRPIRHVMGELTQSVPGFSRIPPAKARRIVVAALEGRHGGGVDGSVAFCKTGWGRWDAHIKGSSKDSGVGSFNDGHTSPPRSEESTYAMSNGDSGVHMRGPRRYRDPNSGSWQESSIREEDELDMEMDLDLPENEADKMSMDGDDMMEEGGGHSSSMNDDTDEENWAAVGIDALRKASMPPPGAPRINYNAIAIPIKGPSRTWARRPSAYTRQASYSSTAPYNSARRGSVALSPALATPEERAAIAALLSLGGSM